QEKLKRIGEEVSERLEYVPASLVVIEEAGPKYTCPKGCPVVMAEKPLVPIEKGCQDRDCWRRWRSASMGITCPCTVRKRSSGGRVWSCHARRCASGCADAPIW